MKIELLQDMAIAPEGHTVVQGKKGDQFNIDDSGGKCLVDARLAKEVGAAPENKDAGSAPENKSRGKRSK